METPPKTLDDILTMQEAMRLLSIPAGQNMRIYHKMKKYDWWTEKIGDIRIFSRAEIESEASRRADVPERPHLLESLLSPAEAAQVLGCTIEWLYVLSGRRPNRPGKTIEVALHPVSLGGDLLVWDKGELEQYDAKRHRRRSANKPGPNGRERGQVQDGANSDSS